MVVARGCAGSDGVFFGKRLLRLCAALVQGGEEREGPHGPFAGKGSAAHLHPVPETKPHQLKYSSETPRDQE